MRGIVKRWSPRGSPVLAGVELELARSELVAVTGRNGAGKTTLLRIAAGLLTPDSGETRMLGIDPERHRTEYNRRLGFLSAGNTGLYARLNVEQHLELWGRLSLMSRPRRREAAAEMSDAFGLDELRGRRVDRLSMGQRQRLRLALAFLHRPDVALLDEPYTSLDEPGMVALRGAIEALRARGGAALVCAPEPDLGRVTPERVYVVGDGRLEAAPWPA